jgi:hypothetical protein
MTGLAMQSIPDDRASGFATHEVLNQPGALEDYNAYSDDKPLVEAVRVFGADWAADHLKQAGTLVGSEKVQYLARQANRHLPELRTHDRFGHRVGGVSPRLPRTDVADVRMRDAFVRLDA